MTLPKLLDRLKCEFKMKNNEKIKNWGTFLRLHQLGGGRRMCWTSKMGLGKMTNIYSFTWTYTKPNNKLLVHYWSIFGASTSHRKTQTHKTHHGPNLREGTTFPFIVYCVTGHETSIQMAFCPETPKCKSRNSQSWDSDNFEGA